MKICVLSCDKNEDLFYPFKHCLEKYYPDHPEVVYFTESISNPYYKTISIPHDLSEWTAAVVNFLMRVNDDRILLMIDDIFIRRPVDSERIDQTALFLTGNNIACFNFERSWDTSDEPSIIKGWNKRKHGSQYEVSLMCGLWDKSKLINVLSQQLSDPWAVEYNQPTCGYDYYINAGDPLIDWGYKTFQHCGVIKGKWAHEIVPFFLQEGIDMNYSDRGFCVK